MIASVLSVLLSLIYSNMYIYKLTIILILFFASCQKMEVNLEEESACISQKIEAYKTSKLPCEFGKSIYRYKFQGEYVYVFNPGNCGADMMSDIFDQNCNLICGLGGIAGNLICNNQNFWENSTDETLIWQN